jgi:hypothetical protein
VARVSGALVVPVLLLLLGHTVALVSGSPLPLAGASLGDGGWVGAQGYRFRLRPGWFLVPSAPSSGAEGTLRPDDSALRITVVSVRNLPTGQEHTGAQGLGSRRFTVAGHGAVQTDATDNDGVLWRRVAVEDGDREFVVTLTGRPSDGSWQDATRDLGLILGTWQWHTASPRPVSTSR